MTGQALQHVENLRQCARDGLTYDEASHRTGICYGYVVRLAKANGIEFKRKLGKAEAAVDKIRLMAAEGVSRDEAARCLSLNYLSVLRVAVKHGIQFVHAGKQTAPSTRTKQMAALFQSGKTLQQIGDQYGVTRERVRQLIEKFHGLKGRDGGKAKIGADRRAVFEAKRNAKSLKRWGCNWEQYVTLRNMRKPTRAYSMQRRNARDRGIGWELNLWQWWSIWQQSGKWAQRGRGQGYMMCRKGDLGPYAIDNVFIATGCENSSNQARKKSGLPIGVRKNKKCAGYTAFRQIKGKKLRLGSHPTPELAHAAYLAAGASQ